VSYIPDQLEKLREAIEPALQKEKLTDCLAVFGKGLEICIPASVIAILGKDEGGEFLLLRSCESVTRVFLDKVEKNVISRFEEEVGKIEEGKISGIEEGREVVKEGPESIHQSCFIPLKDGRKTVGILLAVAAEEEAFSEEIINFLHHAVGLFLRGK